MSRSFKKYPICKQNTRKGKKFANKKVRAYLKRGEPMYNGSYYKKVFCSYDICDYGFTETKSEVIKNWEIEQKELLYNIKPWRKRFTLQEELIMWYTSYKMK